MIHASKRSSRHSLSRSSPLWLDLAPLPREKFRDPTIMASGARRASVSLRITGVQCKLACADCYMENSATNDSVAYLGAAEVHGYLDEIARLDLPTRSIGFAGGEPFLNRDLPAMLDDGLARGHTALIRTNAMRPMRCHKAELLSLRARHGEWLE